MYFLKKVFYFIFIAIFSITLFLTVFELVLYNFQEPIASPIRDLTTHTATWMYLIKQQYTAFIDLDIYNIYEKRHLLDVKRVLDSTYKLWLVLLSLSIISLVLFRKKYKIFLKQVAIFGLALSILLIVSSINFMSSFQFFHGLFFNAKTWIFPSNSTLIELFPLIYFQQFFFIVLVGSMVLFISLFFLNNPRHSKTSS